MEVIAVTLHSNGSPKGLGVSTCVDLTMIPRCEACLTMLAIIYIIAFVCGLGRFMLRVRRTTQAIVQYLTPNENRPELLSFLHHQVDSNYRLLADHKNWNLVVIVIEASQPYQKGGERPRAIPLAIFA